MTALGLCARWIHLGAGIFLVGTFAFLLLAGRSDRPTALAWEQTLLRWCRWVVALLFLSGLLGLAAQAAAVAGRPSAALAPATLFRLVSATQFGTVWLLRHGLLLLLAGLILLREREESGWDWAAFRGEGLLLGATGLGLMAWAGHAAAVEPWGLAAAGADALHLLAVGIWLGGLLPLFLLLRASSTDAGADARPFAVLATRSFSQLALAAVLTLAATGIWNSWNQVGSIAGLVGTRYGHLLLLKLGLLAPILALAAVNRRRFIPALAGEAETIGRPAMRRLAQFVRIELVLGVLILAIVVGMAVTPPGRHTQSWWPFPFRLSYAAAQDAPGVKTRLLIGSQLALAGCLGALAGWVLGWRRRLVVGTAVAVGLAGFAVALPPLALPAYPTTYRRPAVPYQAASIALGHRLYLTRCAACHGEDLGGPRLSRRTAGDLFWLVTPHAPDRRPLAAEGSPSDEERWDLVNFLRALSAAAEARTLGATVEPERPRIVAPDFTYAVGPAATHSLKDFRGRRVVLLVLFSLPESRARLSQLARNYDILQTMGAEVVAVPTDGGAQIITRLGATPRILFPVVTEGAREIVDAYALFRLAGAGPSHLEFLIDRQGYLRARTSPEEKGWPELAPLLAEIQELNQEAPAAPPPDEHVH